MSRFIVLPLLLAAVVPARCLAQDDAGSDTPPMTYELMINGESFFIEADRQVKLESQEKPGVTYEVALRVALEQRVRLNSFRFEYDWPAKVEDDRRKPHRTVRIRHELGFSMLITDLGQPLEPDAQDKVLKVLRESTLQSFQEAGMREITIGELASREFGGSSGRGVMIRYRDGEGLDRTCLIYLMTGPTFAGYCIIEYSDASQAGVLAPVKKTLDSIRAIR